MNCPHCRRPLPSPGVITVWPENVIDIHEEWLTDKHDHTTEQILFVTIQEGDNIQKGNEMNKFAKLLERFKKDNSSRLDLGWRELEALRLFAMFLDDEALTEKQWRHVYEKRLIERGYIRQDAFESAQAAEYVSDVDPNDAADDEVSYEMTA